MISIHAPRGGSDLEINVHGGCTITISIHAPRGGSDESNSEKTAWQKKFQSTLPVGGATSYIFRLYFPIDISIHAPRGGSDSKDAQFYLRIFGEKVNFECDFLVNSRCQPVS